MVEVTENVSQTKDDLIKMKELGLKFAIDDFGISYSYLRYLALLPLDFLKIDYDFTSKVTEDDNYKQITKTILDFTKSLNFKPSLKVLSRKLNCNICKTIIVIYVKVTIVISL